MTGPLPPLTAPPASSPAPGAGRAHHAAAVEGPAAAASPPATVLPNPPEAGQPGRGGPRVIGLDISLTGTGIASSNGWTERLGRDGITNLPLDQRAGAIVDLANRILGTVAYPHLVVIEAAAYSRSGGGVDERGGLRWRVIHGLATRGVPMAEVSATCLKRYALGKGVGSKTAICVAVSRRFPTWAAGINGDDDNLADAVMLMAAGRDALGHPLAPMPATHRKALDAVTWPEAS